MGGVIGANCICCTPKQVAHSELFHSGKCEKSLLTQNKLTAHTAKAFLIICMDFRFLNDTNRILKEKGYDVNYDWFVIAGVSLGFLQKTYPSWGKSLLDHITISVKLHHVTKIILLDHLDCGAYKTFCPKLKGQKEEYEEHKKNLKIASLELKKEFPKLKVKTWILQMDGKIEIIKNK